MSTKYILAGGYIQKVADGGKAFCEELVRGIEKNPVKILDCVFARPRDSWQETLERDKTLFSTFISNFELELAQPDTFTEQVKNSDVIFLRGGFTKPLMELLAKDPQWMKELDGKVLAGTSAGADAIATYYAVLKTHRVGDGLGLLPIKFIPHWKSDYADEEVSDIDWDQELEKLKAYKEDLEIFTLHEGEFKVFIK